MRTTTARTCVFCTASVGAEIMQVNIIKDRKKTTKKKLIASPTRARPRVYVRCMHACMSARALQTNAA